MAVVHGKGSTVAVIHKDNNEPITNKSDGQSWLRRIEDSLS
jgi:hypothetical protein